MADFAEDWVKDKRGALFHPQTSKPAPHTFEIGLVLGGTVSTGAYTAGALDFLLEALDAWYTRHQNDPPHNVVIKFAGGSSGGAVCAALTTILARREALYPSPEVEVSQEDPPKDNPLWELWVDGFDMQNLLSNSDLPTTDTDAVSLLNSQSIEQAAEKIATQGDNPVEPKHWRPYFPDVYRVVVTLANVRGIPYRVVKIPPYEGYAGADYLAHDDFAWFAFARDSDPTPGTGKWREDEFWVIPRGDEQKLGLDHGAIANLVGIGEKPAIIGHKTFARFATASGSMPTGIAAQELSRPVVHYKFRPTVRPIPVPPHYKIIWPYPDAKAMETKNDNYDFSAVDGGCFNNDPVRLVHRAMAGLIGQNPQCPRTANRAMLMIDPLVDQPAIVPNPSNRLVQIAKSLVGMFTTGARYLTADLDLFGDRDVFSRFQLVPTSQRDKKVGEPALAGAGWGALAGWCAKPFRVHDFLLGRHNMQNYLNTQFILAADNPIFAQRTGLVETFAVNRDGAKDFSAGQERYLPIIPDLTGRVCLEPDWPVMDRGAIKLRWKMIVRACAVLKAVQREIMPGLGWWLLALFVVPSLAVLLGVYLNSGLTNYLDKAKLQGP